MSRSYIPKEENSLPPIYMTNCTEFQFIDAYNDAQLFQQLHSETLKFAVQRNFYVLVKIVKCKNYKKLWSPWIGTNRFLFFAHSNMLYQ